MFELQNSSADKTYLRTEKLAKGWFIDIYNFCPRSVKPFGETEGKGKK
jgi:hypothetical protein